MNENTVPAAGLRIGYVAGVTPGKWLQRWRDRQPDIPIVSFRIDPSEQTQVLLDGRADMSFIRLPAESAGLNVIPLYSELPVVAAPREHEIALFDVVPVTELAAENLVQDADLVPEWRDVSDDIRSGARQSVPRPALVEEGLELVGAGVGIMILPMSLARLHNRKDVIYRPVSGVAETRIGLAWLVGHSSEAIEEFIGIVRGRTESSSRQPSVRKSEQEKARAAEKSRSSQRTVSDQSGQGQTTSRGKRTGVAAKRGGAAKAHSSGKKHPRTGGKGARRPRG